MSGALRVHPACALVSLLLVTTHAAAQDGAAGATSIDPELEAGVELCFTIVDDVKAEEKIVELAARPGLDPAELLRAVITPAPRPPGKELERFELRVPFDGQAFPVQVVPPKRAGDAPPAVVLDLLWNTVASHFPLGANALCWVDQYTPPEFSDEGRDSWRKILHSVSFALGGDPDRLWLTGFSWSGHAGYDVALHRPGLVRGFVALGGGPRRVHYRLLQNLGATRILACCGAKDDPELVWNLQEVGRLAAGLELDWHFTLDPEHGHALPLKGMDGVAALIEAAPPIAVAIPGRGALLADADRVALPWLEIVEVDPAAVAVPARVPVSATASADAQRRATIQAMARKVAQVEWRLGTAKDVVVLELTAKGVRRAALLVKEPWFDLARPLRVVVKGKKVFEGDLRLDPATLLREARRTGDRQRPTVRRIAVDFGS